MPAVNPEIVATTGRIKVKGRPKKEYEGTTELTLKPDVETRNDAATESLIPLSFRAMAAGTIPQAHMGKGKPITIPFNIPPTVDLPTSLPSKWEGRRI